MDSISQAAPIAQSPSVRFIGKCRCGKVHRLEGAIVKTGTTSGKVAGVEVSFWHGAWQASITCDQCSRAHVLLRKIKFSGISDHTCSTRCTGATGFDCSCECRGKNHGRG